MSGRANLSASETAALLDEVAACIRAEIPLGMGLAMLESRQAGRVSNAVADIRSAIGAGVPVEDAIARNLDNHGEQIGAALRVGLRTGNAGESLRRFAALILRRREMKLRSWIALIYPSFVILISYVVLVAVFASVVHSSTDFFAWPGFVQRISNWLIQYWYIPPLTLFLVTGVVGFSSLRRFVPIAWQPSRLSDQSLFCDAVAWQLESQTPLPDAIRGAAGLVGGETLTVDAEAWAAATERGEQAPMVGKSFRPLVVWTINHTSLFESSAANGLTANGADDGAVARSLRQLAKTYHDAESRSWHIWTRWVPVATTCIVGGAMATFYLSAVLWPLYNKLAEVQ